MKHIQESDYHREKARRKAYYLNYVYGWRLRTCIACNGSGSYDHKDSPKCSCCEGTGKERYQGHKALPERG